MIDDNVRERIVRLEQQIEALREALERCRKYAAASKAAMIVGALWALGMLLGLVPYGATGLVGSASAIIGGIVVFGSNTSTERQTHAAIANAEALRAELIGQVGLRLVSNADAPMNRTHRRIQ